MFLSSVNFFIIFDQLPIYNSQHIPNVYNSATSNSHNSQHIPNVYNSATSNSHTLSDLIHSTTAINRTTITFQLVAVF